ncbi:MAG: Chemotaxis response regulator protein-glutamate methylesterase [Elusimicrobia bacterium]|nr:Chemotaxis response regulator protein-glutamate methylesterase [Elusimicrobiota bacterium]
MTVIDIGYQAKDKQLILIVDDEAAIHSVMFDALEDDYRILSAYNGREGVDLAIKTKPALILMDVMMPDIGGYEAVRLLQDNPATRSIPIVIMTAQNFDESTIKLLKDEPNVAGFLPKPFRAKDLRHLIGSTIQKSKPEE